MTDNIQSTLFRLREEFIQRLPERIAMLRTQLDALAHKDPDALEVLHRTAHNLVGTAGTHSLMQLAEAARELEKIVEDLPKDSKINDATLLILDTAVVNLAFHVRSPSADSKGVTRGKMKSV